MSEQDAFAKKVHDAFANAFGVGADEFVVDRCAV